MRAVHIIGLMISCGLDYLSKTNFNERVGYQVHFFCTDLWPLQVDYGTAVDVFLTVLEASERETILLWWKWRSVLGNKWKKRLFAAIFCIAWLISRLKCLSLWYASQIICRNKLILLGLLFLILVYFNVIFQCSTRGYQSPGKEQPLFNWFWQRSKHYIYV